jgi:hypothetical protein
MDTRQEEVVVTDPVTGETQASQTIRHTASQGEVLEAKAQKKNQVLWYIAGIINILLALRLVFLLFGARQVGFASALYSITNPFVAPFKGIFASPSTSGSYFDSGAVLAIVIYALLAWGLSALIDVLGRPAATKQP